MRGQQMIKAASVMMVGVGGLGSPISLYLAAAGVGRIGLVDPDQVEVSNLQRQVIHSTFNQGMLKVESARRRITEINPSIQVETYPKRISSHNAMELVKDYDIIVDGTDNIPSRYLLSDLSVFTGKPMVYGSIYRFEGQVSVFGTKNGPCYRCLFPEPPPPGAIPTCEVAGVMGVLPGIIGTLQAIEVIKLITGIGKTLAGRLLLLDGLDMSIDIVNLRKRESCPVCGTSPSISSLIDYESWCGGPALNPDPGSAGVGLDIEPIDAARLIATNQQVVVLDVREPFEYELSKLPDALLIPQHQITERINEIPTGIPVIVICRNGIRSALVTQQLRALGYDQIVNLHGGINGWSDNVDPTIQKY